MPKEKSEIEPVDLKVGENIRFVRLFRGVTQQLLGEKIGKSFQQLQKYETGANRVSASVLSKIAEALDVSPEIFFGGIKNASDVSVKDDVRVDFLTALLRVSDMDEQRMSDMGALFRIPDEEKRKAMIKMGLSMVPKDI